MPTTTEPSHREGVQPSGAWLQAHARTRSYARGQAVYRVGDPTDRWYRVLTGIAIRCANLSDGRRQILELLFPGDFFGFSAGAEHLHWVEILVGNTSITSYRRRRLEDLAAADPEVDRVLRKLAFAAIARLDGRVLTVGHLSATERVEAFLAELAERLPADSTTPIHLPMSRFEIADYLGLSMETVSRAIGQLSKKAVISLLGPHRVVVREPSGLASATETRARDGRAERRR